MGHRMAWHKRRRDPDRKARPSPIHPHTQRRLSDLEVLHWHPSVPNKSQIEHNSGPFAAYLGLVLVEGCMAEGSMGLYDQLPALGLFSGSSILINKGIQSIGLNGCFYKFGVLFVSVLMMRALLMIWVYMKAG